MPYVKPEDCAYVAGVIDSDGYIGLVRRRENRRKQYTEQYVPIVKVTQAKPQAVEFIKNHFGGNNGIINPQSDKRKPLYRWEFSSIEKTKNFLEIIEPYLKIKKKQAQLVIEFCSVREKAIQNKSVLRDDQGKFRKGSSKNTYTGIEKQLWKQVLRLNQTGPKHAISTD